MRHAKPPEIAGTARSKTNRAIPQVVIDPGAGGFTNMGGTIDVGNGTFNVIPEPASLVLLGIGLLGVLGYARYATRRAAA